MIQAQTLYGVGNKDTLDNAASVNLGMKWYQLSDSLKIVKLYLRRVPIKKIADLLRTRRNRKVLII